MAQGNNKKRSPVELFLCRFAADIIGPEKVETLSQPQYLPLWKWGSVALVGILLMMGHFSQLITNLVGFTYPAYCSIKALESPSKEDDTRWLTYWVVFAAFSITDSFSSWLLNLLPFYWLLKVVFLAWCFSSTEYNGSAIIYERVIRPFFMGQKPNVSAALKEFGKEATKVAEAGISIAENIKANI